MKFTFPKHRYLGPGNKLDAGEPVDSDDYIARKHDYKYFVARSSNDILKADVESISEFWNDFLQNKNWHSLLGAGGLKVKNLFEKSWGVVYPQMPEHRGHLSYARIQKALSAAYNQRTDQTETWLEFQKRWYREGHHRNVNVSAGGSNANTEPVDNTPGGGGGSSNADQRTAPAAEEGRRNKRPRTGSPSDSGDNSELADWFLDENNMEVPMDTLPANEQLNAQGPRGGAAQADAASAKNAVLIPRSLRSKKMVHTFSKTRLAYSYGYACAKIETTSKFDKLTTSLALIPVDCVGFYLTPQEWNDLPKSARVVGVACSVKILGLRTSFDTQSTTAGSANTEHVAIGWYAVGLNKTLNTENQSYVSVADAPMIPTSTTNPRVQDIIDKLYGDSTAHIVGIPRSLSIYLVLYTTSRDNPEVPHTVGWQQLDKHVQRFNVVAATGRTLIEYTYSPIRGELKTKNYHGHYGKSVDLYTHDIYDSLTLEKWQLETNKSGQLKVSDKKTETKKVNYCGGPIEYEAFVEKSMSRKINTKSDNWCTVQPQVHIGLQAIPQLNPATELTNFQNSSMYYEISSAMHVEIDFDSPYVRGDQHYYPEEVVLQGGKHKYIPDMLYAFGCLPLGADKMYV